MLLFLYVQVTWPLLRSFVGVVAIVELSGTRCTFYNTKSTKIKIIFSSEQQPQRFNFSFVYLLLSHDV